MNPKLTMEFILSNQLSFLDTVNPTPQQVASPGGYKGLHAFHKYWGKKPLEPLMYLVDNLSEEGDIVVDPFMGSCSSGIAALRLNRRFIGIDLNPIAVRLSSLLLAPPNLEDVLEQFKVIENYARDKIFESYISPSDKHPITHYLWEESTIKKLIVTSRGRGRQRREYKPLKEDVALSDKFEGYIPQKFRSPTFFNNSRINAKSDLTFLDIFTGRALRNMEILMDAIATLPLDSQLPMLLCLTASSGQMSKMVFAITKRGKNTGRRSDRVEVGSWVIGYWRPKLHFEVNSWNCFANKAKKLISGIKKAASSPTFPELGTLEEILSGSAQYSLIEGDAVKALDVLPDKSIDLIVTDPPHSDRAPYLELSELWNALLGLNADFSSEIVVSNARERGKNLDDYSKRMESFVESATSKIKEDGTIAVIFNARGELSWEFFKKFEDVSRENGIRYVGNFPLAYSAGSVVQDNRRGALKNDYVLLFSPSSDVQTLKLSNLPGWSDQLPVVNSGGGKKDGS